MVRAAARREETLKNLEKALRKLEQAFSLGFKGVYTNIFNHEIKNQIYEVAALARVLSMEDPGSAETRRIVKAVETMVRTLDELNHAPSSAAGNLDPGRVVRECVAKHFPES
jgi:light-regulated signal transduction histidine kinase (bacteriophytochrome)